MTKENTENAEYAEMVRVGAKIAKDNIVYWLMELQHRHDEVAAEMVNEDEYQLGYLHGLTSAITYFNDSLNDIYKHDAAMVDYIKEMRNDQEQD